MRELQPGPPTQASPPPPPPSSTTSSTATTIPLVNHVGATLNDPGLDTAITLQQVIDPAQSDNQYVTPDPGKRYVGIRLKMTYLGSSHLSGDVLSDAFLVGTDDQDYSPDSTPMVGCTQFDNGSYDLYPNQSVIGCVLFQVPEGVGITRAQLLADNVRYDWQVP